MISVFCLFLFFIILYFIEYYMRKKNNIKSKQPDWTIYFLVLIFGLCINLMTQACRRYNHLSEWYKPTTTTFIQQLKYLPGDTNNTMLRVIDSAGHRYIQYAVYSMDGGTVVQQIPVNEEIIFQDIECGGYIEYPIVSQHTGQTFWRNIFTYDYEMQMPMIFHVNKSATIKYEIK